MSIVSVFNKIIPGKHYFIKKEENAKVLYRIDSVPWNRIPCWAVVENDGQHKICKKAQKWTLKTKSFKCSNSFSYSKLRSSRNSNSKLT